MSSSNRGGMSYEFERAGRTLFKRCLECPDKQPVCPSCDPGFECVLMPTECHSCAHMKCIPMQSSTPTHHGPNTGALAGGVVAGVAFVALAVYCIWRFWIKKRREQQDMELEEEWKSDEVANQKRRTASQNAASDNASTRTRGSLANSILSRASNIIQIAYIPGVTHRGGSNDNSVYNPPVPPIPAAFRSGQQTPKSPLSNEGDALFFRPGDLRDSTWSDSSSFRTRGNRDTQYTNNRDTHYTNNRDTQYTMNSITPSLARSSVASDIVYYDDATATPLPANAAQRAAPRMVSIKTGSSSPSSESAPGTPPATSGNLQVMMPGAGTSATGARGKATQVTVGGKGKSRLSSSAAGNSPAIPSPLISSSTPSRGNSTATSSDDEDEHARARASLFRVDDTATTATTGTASSNASLSYFPLSVSSAPSSIVPTPQPLSSPFYDATERPISSSSRPNPYASMASSIRRSTDGPLRRGSKSIGALSAVIEEASKGLTRIPSSEELEGADVPAEEVPLRASVDSPFSDRHATN